MNNNSDKNLKVVYWDPEKRLASSLKLDFEAKIRTLGITNFITVSNLNDQSLEDCDLIITSADHVDTRDLSQFMNGLCKRVETMGMIWIPALILSTASYSDLSGLTESIVQQNWYFDFIHPDHLDSLPMRAANLLKIHDHLLELNNYEQKLRELEQQVEDLREKLK